MAKVLPMALPPTFRIDQDQRGDGRRSTTGHDAADIADHVAADGTDTLCITQQPDRLLGADDLTRRHGMEGFFIGRCDCHANDIKDDTNQNNCKQDQKACNNAAAAH